MPVQYAQRFHPLKQYPNKLLLLLGLLRIKSNRIYSFYELSWHLT
jgi:hypothetical protein